MCYDKRMMAGLRLHSYFLLLATLVSFSCTLSSFAQEAIRIATAGSEGAYYRLGELLKERIEATTPYSFEVLVTDGSIENVNLLMNGEAEFGLIQGALGIDLSGLVAVSNLDRQYVHLVVPADSRITSIGELSGKRVDLGPAQSGFNDLGRAVLDFYDLSPAPTVVNSEISDLKTAFEEGRIDAAFTVYSLYAPFIEELLRSNQYRLVEITGAGALSRAIPGTFADEIPKHAYGVSRTLPVSPLWTLGVNTLLVSRPDVASSRVDAVLDAIYGTEFTRSAALPKMAIEDGEDVSELPLHRAAHEYYHQDDPVSSDMFEIASFFLGGLIALVTAFHYILGKREQREMDRKRHKIQPFFEKLAKYGTKLEQADDQEELSSIILAMMATRREAERLWLNDEIDVADMENLNDVFSTRSRNAFSSIQTIQVEALVGKMEEVRRRLDEVLPEGKGE